MWAADDDLFRHGAGAPRHLPLNRAFGAGEGLWAPQPLFLLPTPYSLFPNPYSLFPCSFLLYSFLSSDQMRSVKPPGWAF